MEFDKTEQKDQFLNLFSQSTAHIVLHMRRDWCLSIFTDGKTEVLITLLVISVCFVSFSQNLLLLAFLFPYLFIYIICIEFIGGDVG